jgi:hypothetical protein
MVSIHEEINGNKGKQLETKSSKSFQAFPLPDRPCAKRQGDKPGERGKNGSKN